MITISYKNVKNRLLKAYKSGVLDLLHNGMRYTTYEKVQIFSQAILGTTDITRLNGSSFRAQLRKIIKDFHVDAIGYHKNYIGEDSEVARINAFLSEAYNELKNFNQEGPDTIDYIPRTEEELKEEQEKYRQLHGQDKADDYELNEPQKKPEPKTQPEESNSTTQSASPSNVEDSYTKDKPKDAPFGTYIPSVDVDDITKEQGVPNDFGRYTPSRENPANTGQSSSTQSTQTPDNDPTRTTSNSPSNPGTPIPANPTPSKSELWLKSLKKLAPWGLGGMALGLGASIVIPSATLFGLGNIRLVYAGLKFTNKIVSKKFLNGEPTPIDKVIDMGKKKLQEKYGDTKVYKGAKKVNDFLKNPKVQWFINGVSIGYSVGNMLNLHDRVLNNINQNGIENINTSTNDLNSANTNTPNAPEPNVPTPNTPNTPTPNTPTPDVINTPNYDWLNTGQNVDLSGVERGFTDSINAMGNNNSLHLINELASKENGTFIKWLRLPDGSTFTGNIGDLLNTGIDPSTVAARVMNQGGDYSWLNLQDILEATESVGRSL